IALIATAVALAALPTPANWPLASGLGGATGAMILELLDRVTSAGSVALGLGVGLVGTATLFFALGLPVRTYIHTTRRLHELSDRRAGWVLRLYERLRSNSGDGATRRAERSHQQRLGRLEPQLERNDRSEDVAVVPPLTTRSTERNTTAAAPPVAK